MTVQEEAASSVALPAAAPTVVASADTQNEWDEYVRAHPASTGYHLWRWRHVFERAFGHRTEYLIARRRRQVVGVLPLVVFRHFLFGRFAVSLPFVNYGGVASDDEDAARALLAHATEIARNGRLAHVELRHQSRQFNELPCKQHKVGMTLPLSRSVDDAWRLLDRKVRNQVRKAEKSGLVAESGGRELIPEFYRVFAQNMRDLGTPVYSRALFTEVFEQFPEAARVFLVRHESTTVAAGIAYRYRQGVEVPWASSLVAYRSMCPNNLLYWRVIEWAIAEGIRTLDFGRSTPNEGTYHFKRQWGAEAHPLCWEYRLLGGATMPDQSPKNPKFAVAVKAWKRMPVAVARIVGPRIVRSIP